MFRHAMVVRGLNFSAFTQKSWRDRRAVLAVSIVVGKTLYVLRVWGITRGIACLLE